MGLKVGTVKLEEYDTNWEKMFLEEKENLRKFFKDFAISIEHIGSTSVKDIKAKPIIDIAVGVKSLNDFKNLKEIFEIPPYSVKENYENDEVLIRKGNEDNITHFIHVMEINGKRYKDTIIFRDCLRNNKKILDEYERLKIDLAEKYKDDRKMYTKSKNDFIQNVLKNMSKI